MENTHFLGFFPVSLIFFIPKHTLSTVAHQALCLVLWNTKLNKHIPFCQDI